MDTNLTELFDTYAYKKVSKTDKDKQALVVTKDIARVLASAGVSRSDAQPHPRFLVQVVDEFHQILEANYYASLRKTDPSRKPEPRMGLQVIHDWLNVGDHLLIGNLNRSLFARRLVASEELARQMEGLKDIDKARIVGRIDKDTLRRRAMGNNARPTTKTIKKAVHCPNADVVLSTLIRARGRCEMPECGIVPFRKSDGAPYLEAHYIEPISQGGDESLENTAGLCPNCRRELQFGADRNRKGRALAHKIRQIEREYDD